MKLPSFQTLVLLAVAVWASRSAAQTGSLSGVVYPANPLYGSSVEGARVRVNLPTGDGYGFQAETVSGERGLIWMDNLPPGIYQVWASYPGLGFVADVAEISPNSTTVIELMISGGANMTEGEQQAVVTLQGFTLLNVHPETNFAEYFLDVGADCTLDYRLLLGPPWYMPPGNVNWPENHQPLTITGHLFAYSQPPMIVVNFVGQQFWRDSTGHSHGGSGGGLYEQLACDATLSRMESSGWVELISPTQGSEYLLHDSLGTDYLLDFGASTYDPGSGAQRPADNQEIRVVGGLAWCDSSQLARILVYEINDLFWRTPGDTLGFGALPVTPLPEYVPVSHLVAENYPNPFNATTTIRFSVPRTGHVRVAVLDILGQEITTLADDLMPSGNYAVAWNAAGFSSGIYLCVVNAGYERTVTRMVLLR